MLRLPSKVKDGGYASVRWAAKFISRNGNCLIVFCFGPGWIITYFIFITIDSRTVHSETKKEADRC